MTSLEFDWIMVLRVVPLKVLILALQLQLMNGHGCALNLVFSRVRGEYEIDSQGFRRRQDFLVTPSSCLSDSLMFTTEIRPTSFAAHSSAVRVSFFG